jgi:predicted phage-related endonuclease
MKEAEVGTIGDRRITWKSISKSSVDTKRLKAEQPEVYTSYLTQSQYRRLSVA